MNKKGIKSGISKTKDFLLEFLFPPKCSVCGKLLDINGGALCCECLEKWNQEKEKECVRCKRIASFCTCNTKLNKTAIISYYSSCIMYESEFSKKIISSLKYKRQKKLVKFMAEQLCNNFYAMYGVDIENCIVVYPPRSKRSLKKYGFDHARMLAEEFGKRVDLPVFHGMSNKGIKEQKYLNYEERAQNAFESFCIKDPENAAEQLRGKTVIIIDDVTTTGATAVCIAAFLHNSGADTVKFLSCARTPEPHKRNL